jgi:hypothetical protein
MFWIGLGIGIIAGGTMGVFVMSLCVAAKSEKK